MPSLPSCCVSVCLCLSVCAVLWWLLPVGKRCSLGSLHPPPPWTTTGSAQAKESSWWPKEGGWSSFSSSTVSSSPLRAAAGLTDPRRQVPLSVCLSVPRIQGCAASPHPSFPSPPPQPQLLTHLLTFPSHLQEARHPPWCQFWRSSDFANEMLCMPERAPSMPYHHMVKFSPPSDLINSVYKFLGMPPL